MQQNASIKKHQHSRWQRSGAAGLQEMVVRSQRWDFNAGYWKHEHIPHAKL